MKTTKTNITIQDAVIAAKCRKGPAADTTKKGAYWLALDQKTKGSGGDGIGQSSADVTFCLQLRHFRDGTVTAGVRRSSWHQNHGSSYSYIPTPSVLGCQTAEDVIVILKGTSEGCEHVLSTYFEDEVVTSLANLGIPAALPAPDEEA